MDKQSKKDACYLGKDNRHLITAICNGKTMSVTIQSTSGVQSYSLGLIPQDGYSTKVLNKMARNINYPR